MSKEVYAVSIDIGKKNFAIVIEKFDKKELGKIDNLEKNDRYNSDGTCTDSFLSVLDQVYMVGEIIMYDKVDLTTNCDAKKTLDPESYHNLTVYLDSIKERYLDKCSLVLIERQMAFGKKINLMAVKLAQHCYSYFQIKYGRKMTVIDFDAFNKTLVLGAPKVEGKKSKKGKYRFKSMKQTDRKKWAVEKAVEILEIRGDSESMKKIMGSKKKDDFADCFVQLQSAKYMYYVDNCDM